MNDRERFLACVMGKPVDRAPYWLCMAPWGSTWERWQQEGMPAEFKDFESVRQSFGADGPVWGPPVVSVDCGPFPFPDQQILEETEEFVVFLDSWGIKRRNFKNHMSMSEFIEFPVKNRRDWERYRDQWLDPQEPRRLAGDWRKNCAEWSAKGWPIQLGYYPDSGLYGALRWLLGDEGCLVMFYDDPGLVHEIMDHMTTVQLAVYEKVAAEVRIDIVHMWEDMCGKQGPLISPRHFEEFMGPGYRRIKRFMVEHEIPVLSVDTDGQPELIIRPMMQAGVNLIFPWEVAAGCDVNEVRRRYPELALLGGIDKRALAHGPEAIDRELERIRPAIKTGRYIPDLDHHIPDDVSWENFKYYAKRLKEMVGKR